jgi:hypothetical protein
MSGGSVVASNTGAVAAASAAAVAQAIKASGVIVNVKPENFMRVLTKADHPLIVTTTGGFLKKNFQYLFSYKGLAFYTKSPEPMNLPAGSELISADKIWIP